MNYHSANLPKMDVPFPALTSEQRLHFEIYGYVVVNDVFTQAECADLINVLKELKEDLKEAGYPISFTAKEEDKVRGAGVNNFEDPDQYLLLADIEQAHHLITSYMTHPRLLGMNAEVIGGEIRLVEANAVINKRLPNWTENKPKSNFHRGVDSPYGSHYRNGLFHSCFSKTLTNLTDLGPDDGGTIVIAGSHKLDVPVSQMVECARKDPSLIHQVIAPAGSTLLFAESLIHDGGEIRSDKERVNIIGGYASSHMPYWGDGKWTQDFCDSIPDNLKILFHGRQNWSRSPKERPELMAENDSRSFALGDWQNRASV